ncbi:4Fe-4S binding protein, partial [Synechococcus sp. BA-120 BA3]|nr:4Fe-4S binding protein [Synechococcus sp. BA-120 BA3]
LGQGPLLGRLAFAALALALPSGLWLLLRPLAARLRPASPSWLLLYALLPLLWGLLLAQHLPMGMAEGGRLLPVSTETLWPALAARLPSWSADSHVIAFCQSLAVLVGVGGSLLMLRRLLQLAFWSGPSLALGGLVVALGSGGRWLVAGS